MRALKPGQQQDYLFANREQTAKPVHIYIDEPPIGNKVHLIVERGMFVLERGPCVWLGMSCTHAGSGGIIVYDGVPNDEGYFPEPPKAPFVYDAAGIVVTDWWRHEGRGKNRPWFDGYKRDEISEQAVHDMFVEHARQMGKRNGRPVSHAHPASMGMHMFSGGLHHGLTVVSVGEMQGTASMLTFTWYVQKARAK